MTIGIAAITGATGVVTQLTQYPDKYVHSLSRIGGLLAYLSTIKSLKLEHLSPVLGTSQNGNFSGGVCINSAPIGGFVVVPPKSGLVAGMCRD